MDLAALFTTENLIAFLTLAALEIVLGIDNIIVIAVVTSRLPKEKQRAARNVGLALAMVMRVLLLLAIGWVMGLTRVLFELDLTGWGMPLQHEITGKDVILLGGGLFLIAKATKEIHAKMEGPELHETGAGKAAASFGMAIAQILLLDAVFSLDSVITAVGMAKEIAVMVAAVIVAVIVMMIFAGAISRFVERHPTVKVLALSFLILIGVLLTADGLGQHLSRGYVYFAMAFSLGVELINLRVRAAQERSRVAKG